MSRRLRIGLAVSAVALAAGAGLFGRWALREREQSLPALPVSTVPASWHDFRQGDGHIIHVTEQGIACTKCHGSGKTFGAPSMRVCQGCHAREANMQHGLRAHALTATFAVADCTACHAFRETRAGPLDCIRCHELQQGDVHAIAVHAQQRCGLCHKPHDEPSIAPAACVSCHAEAQNAHAHLPSSQPGNCLTCHSAHLPASSAEQRCVECHDKPHALVPGAHTRCTGCHRPHGFARDDVAECKSCHSQQHVIGEDNPKTQHACTNCHDPHDVRQVSDATCQQCHTTVAPTHPAAQGHTCLSCHRPHAQSAPVPLAQACTQCHTQAANDQAAHGAQAQCTSCHRPHAFAHPAQATSCSSCHAVQLTATASNPGHAQCKGCHRGDIHQMADLTPIACKTCHQQVEPRAEHTQCTACHEPHAGAARPFAQSCGQCHAAEVKSVATLHSNCLTCHTPHDGGRSAACTSCHAVKGDQNHGQIPGGCTQCHAIHGERGPLATPSCTSCHAVASLPGLHAVPAHQECNQCHRHAHDKGPFSERATCTSCHKDKVDHVPEAQLCQGCHVFRR